MKAAERWQIAKNDPNCLILFAFAEYLAACGESFIELVVDFPQWL
jgi:hypothetical protein